MATCRGDIQVLLTVQTTKKAHHLNQRDKLRKVFRARPQPHMHGQTGQTRTGHALWGCLQAQAIASAEDVSRHRPTPAAYSADVLICARERQRAQHMCMHHQHAHHLQAAARLPQA
eukprot:GHRQ01037428.1.p1 GENE.GHRQ01037428.1~~GHRQ01037428.1.p1  ORF type:complete len:116 (+),score=14.31 GHRQ01037428.1:329-676(+)